MQLLNDAAELMNAARVVKETDEKQSDKPQNTVKEKPTPIRANRITVVETVYHQQLGEDPISVTSKFVRDLNHEEQAYYRRRKVGEDWTKLIDSKCWVENVGMVFITNDEGRFSQVNPTETEKAEAEKKSLQLCINGQGHRSPDLLVHPKESLRLTFVDTRHVVISSASGTCRFSIYVFPS